MHGTKAFDDRRNDGIKEMLRRLRSEMRSDAASAPCGNDPAPPPLVQQSAGGLGVLCGAASWPLGYLRCQRMRVLLWSVCLSVVRWVPW